jgi:NTE family protein
MGFEEWYGEPVGLVLNGGGGKGAYQVGAFKAIRQAGLSDKITAVAGSSVGALNMCLFAYDGGTVGEDIWQHISPEQFIDPELDMLDGREGFVSRQGLLDIIDGYLDLEKIRNNKLSLYATVTAYDGDGTARARYMQLNGKSDSEIKNILLASSSLPVIYEPVVMDGIMYRDGGLTDNLPIKPLYDIGIRKFIVVLLSQQAEIDESRFVGSEFFVIRPSRDLGDTLTGTLDFTAEGAKYRSKLGYLDASHAIRFYNEDNTYADDIKNIELRQLDNSITVEHAMDKANEDFGNINKLLGKYGI